MNALADVDVLLLGIDGGDGKCRALCTSSGANDPIAVKLLRLAGSHICVPAQRLFAFGVDRRSLADGLAASTEPCLANATPHHLVTLLGDTVAGALQMVRDAAGPANDLTISRRPR
jgi:N-acetylglucosamine kinase-like BadF-type ATPase